MSTPDIVDLREAPLALYLCQIAAHRRRHHPLIDQGDANGTSRILVDPQSTEQRERQTELLLAARRRAA